MKTKEPIRWPNPTNPEVMLDLDEELAKRTTKRSATLIVGFTDDCDYNITALGTTENAQTTILAAINALPTAGGKIVLREGTYKISASLALTKANVTLTGQGPSTVLIKAFNGVMINLRASYITFQHITFDGSDTIYNATLLNYCMDSTSAASFILIQNCIFTSFIHYVIYTPSASSMQIVNNFFRDNAANSYTHVTVGNKSVVANNVFEIQRSAISLLSSFCAALGNTISKISGNGPALSSSGIQNVISGNNISSVTKSQHNGIMLQGQDTNVSAFHLVTGNVISNFNVGIEFFNTNNDSSAVGNIISNCTTGIYVPSGSNYNLLSSNILKNNTTAINNAGVGTLIRANKNGATNIES